MDEDGSITMKHLKLGTLLFALILPLAIGGISGAVTASAIDSWYSSLAKPSFNPPNWLFAPVWSVLYLLMGVSFYRILAAPKTSLRETSLRKKAIALFSAQLFLNFWWSIIFFGFHAVGLALIDIALMWMLIIWMIVVFRRISVSSGNLQLPYLLWVSFATALNGAILILN